MSRKHQDDDDEGQMTLDSDAETAAPEEAEAEPETVEGPHVETPPTSNDVGEQTGTKAG